MKRRFSLKPKTYPESVNVDVAGISGKVSAHYPGRSGGGVYFCAMDELGTHDAYRKGVSWKLSSCGKESKLPA